MGTPQHDVTSYRVMVPVLDGQLIDRACLPWGQRIVAALFQPDHLLVPVDIQVVFEEPEAGIDEHALEDRSVVEKPLGLLFAAEAHDPLDAGAVIPGAVE